MQERVRDWLLRWYFHGGSKSHDVHDDGHNDEPAGGIYESDAPDLGGE
jgi:hypothetical protein